jgi:hypothetical protein
VLGKFLFSLVDEAIVLPVEYLGVSSQAVFFILLRVSFYRLYIIACYFFLLQAYSIKLFPAAVLPECSALGLVVELTHNQASHIRGYQS